MNYKAMSFILVFFQFVIWSNNASALELSIECNNCASTYNAANNFSDVNTDIYRINIIDFEKENIDTYRVALVDGTSRKTVRKISTSSSLLSKFNAFFVEKRKYIQAAKGSDVSLGGIQSGWDLYASRENRELFEVWAHQNVTLGQHAANIVNLLSGITTLARFDLTIPLSFTLPDGSTIVLSYKFVKIDNVDGIVLSYEIDFDLSTDSEGNPLSLDSTASGGGNGGQYNFFGGGSNFQAFLTALGRVGYSYSGGGGSFATVCSIKGDVVSCTAVMES